MTNNDEERMLKVMITDKERGYGLIYHFGMLAVPGEQWCMVKDLPLTPKHTDEEYEILCKASLYHKNERIKLQARIKELERMLEVQSKIIQELQPYEQYFKNHQEHLKSSSRPEGDK
jgi:hypothetical protein